MRRFIVIPEGVKAGPDGRSIDEPSFIYRQVLDFTLRVARPEDEVYLAPANAFGGPVTEEQAARRYLSDRQAPFRLFHPGHNLPANVTKPAYIDTLDNARLLREALGTAAGEFELVCASHHAPRASWCFRRTGFTLTTVHRVTCRALAEPVPPRLFYYRYPILHRLYERLAFARDFLMARLRLR